MRTIGIGASVVALLTLGCQTDHYLVAHEGTPLYAQPQGERVLARMQRFHNAPLPAPPGDAARVRIAYRGVEGYAPRGKLRFLRYLDPGFDGGADRERALSEAVRAVHLDDVGRSWPPRVREAVRQGRVLPGFSRRQVEVCWGWPLEVLAGEAPGGEVWVYRRTKLRRAPLPADPFAGPLEEPWVFRPGLSRQPWGWRHAPLVDGGAFEDFETLRLLEETRVRFDRAGRVQGLETRLLPLD